MTDALIIAAGYGSRLAERSPCKPLTPVAGLPLIELVIRQAAAAGASRAVVVTGHCADRIEAFLTTLSDRTGLPIAAVRSADWSRPNGLSVLAGASLIEGDYLLLMADHLFERSILERLMARRGLDAGVTLAVDRRLDNPLLDPDDATWVRVGDNDRIAAIGKSLERPHAVDCGAFWATPELAAAIEAAVAAGAAGSLSNGMQRLADAGRAATMDIGPAWWIDIDDPRAHALAEAQAPVHLAALYRSAALTGTSS